MSKWENIIPRPKSKFVQVKCPSCGNEQNIFLNAATTVECNICNTVLAEPRGGKAKINGEIIAVLE